MAKKKLPSTALGIQLGVEQFSFFNSHYLFYIFSAKLVVPSKITIYV